VHYSGEPEQPALRHACGPGIHPGPILYTCRIDKPGDGYPPNAQPDRECSQVFVGVGRLNYQAFEVLSVTSFGLIGIFIVQNKIYQLI
jgi:hypothetical protein